jgi:flavodoxin
MHLMKTLIVYDSFFGNTEKIAEAIGNALSAEIVRVKDIKPEKLKGIELLIVGSPTRAFRPTPAIGSFINKLPPETLKGIKVATFDTGISSADAKPRILSFIVKLFGYAAKPIAEMLRKKGGEVIADPISFWVKDSEGPLKEGEIARSAKWASSFGARS